MKLFSNYVTGTKRSYVLHWLIWVPCLKPQGIEQIDIMYVASFSEPLLSVFNYAPGCQIWPSLGGHMFYLDSYKEKLRFYIFDLVNFVNVINGIFSCNLS